MRQSIHSSTTYSCASEVTQQIQRRFWWGPMVMSICLNSFWRHLLNMQTGKGVYLVIGGVISFVTECTYIMSTLRLFNSLISSIARNLSQKPRMRIQIVLGDGIRRISSSFCCSKLSCCPRQCISILVVIPSSVNNSVLVWH